MSCFDREGAVLRVLVNDEEQYSLWPDFKAIPAGWRDTGVQGDKQTCLAYVEKVWTDMRPLSLRRFMDEQASAVE
ncbi:MbtH family protein [Bordetella bronchialis]|uniref:Antibiotic synthesis protein MbtH n=1 Tax=Bordetella bronchialis TaxID=463025 RepID=A0A193FVH9_9BORD|nr:MbtH family NRPS accessory protein [Bordetella bronchialis]ANN66683.1 antibiotic synthesis protein MbtH [Bordetella bronchialis]ANN71762.1 antibiotic synthesis protein MbtH [Bordetella bronchialis]